MQYKKLKNAKKAKLKLYSTYNAKIYSVVCPFCRVELVSDINTNKIGRAHV